MSNLPDGVTQADIDRHAPEDDLLDWEPGDREPLTPWERELEDQDRRHHRSQQPLKGEEEEEDDIEF